MIHMFVIIYKMKRAQVEKNLLTLFYGRRMDALFPLSYLRDTDKRMVVMVLAKGKRCESGQSL